MKNKFIILNNDEPSYLDLTDEVIDLVATPVPIPDIHEYMRQMTTAIIDRVNTLTFGADGPMSSSMIALKSDSKGKANDTRL